MKQYWSEGELVECWTLTDVERQLAEQHTQRRRLGLAVLVKFFQFEGRFPSYHKEVPLAAVDYVAEQLAVSATTWFDYPLKGRRCADYTSCPRCAGYGQVGLNRTL